MIYVKLETLGTLGTDFIIRSDAYVEHIKEDYTKTNNQIFELDVIKSAIQNANKQSGIKYSLLQLLFVTIIICYNFSPPLGSI